MNIINSVCTNLFFPKSRKSMDEFRHMAQFLSAKGMGSIEFYHDGDGRDKVGNILRDTGLKGVYIGVIPSKEGELYLCDEDEAGRLEAVELFKMCMDEAQANGIADFMINSGRIGRSVEHGLCALKASIEELYNYSAKKNYNLRLLMEPCDSYMDACHLIGPYKRTLAFVQRLHSAGLPLQLTLDSAHTVEEGENFLEVLAALKPYCKQIHFANCNIRDPQSPLYGDKHVGFEYPNTEWTVPALTSLFEGLKDLYKENEDLRIGLEVLCREDDTYSYFNDVWNSLPFLHKP